MKKVVVETGFRVRRMLSSVTCFDTVEKIKILKELILLVYRLKLEKLIKNKGRLSFIITHNMYKNHKNYFYLINLSYIGHGLFFAMLLH